MQPFSTTDPAWLQTVSTWLSEAGDLLVAIRNPGPGCGNVFELLASMESINQRVSRLSPGASVRVFREPELPWRGHADDDYIASVIEAMDSSPWLILSQDIVNDGMAWWYPDATVNSPSELESQLRSELFYQRSVATGPVPSWNEDESERWILASVQPM